MELMSSAVEVSVAEIRETVRRDRCDWLAAIFNLLIEYPEGRAALQKTQVNDEDRGRSLGNSQESLNGTSGFSQGLSQGEDRYKYNSMSLFPWHQDGRYYWSEYMAVCV